jgi:hypothetical protein
MITPEDSIEKVTPPAHLTRFQGHILIILLLTMNLTFIANSVNHQKKFEYRTMSLTDMNNYKRSGPEAFKSNRINFSLESIEEIKNLGEQGWEVVTCYVEQETTIASFSSGDNLDELLSILTVKPIFRTWNSLLRESYFKLPMVRPSRVVLLMKREI